MKLITFETAKLAKQVGYGEPRNREIPFIPALCPNINMYNSRGRLRNRSAPYNCKSGYFPAPYQYILFDWLIEKKYLYIQIDYCDDNNTWIPTILELNSGYVSVETDKFFTKYSDALEFGLQKALKTIIEL